MGVTFKILLGQNDKKPKVVASPTVGMARQSICKSAIPLDTNVTQRNAPTVHSKVHCIVDPTGHLEFAHCHSEKGAPSEALVRSTWCALFQWTQPGCGEEQAHRVYSVIFRQNNCTFSIIAKTLLAIMMNSNTAVRLLCLLLCYSSFLKRVFAQDGVSEIDFTPMMRGFDSMGELQDHRRMSSWGSWSNLFCKFLALYPKMRSQQ